MLTAKQQFLDDLDRDIASLAVQISAATHAMLTKIRLFDEGEGWAAQHFPSCVAYLNFRIGLSKSVAKEKVRIAKALASWPQIDAAFAAGTISFSKVRALTRIATPASEESLLIVANETTASQLEKLVRGYRRANDVASAVAFEARRYLRCYFDADGMFVIDGRLLAEEGALIMKALETAETPKVAMERTKRLADALIRVCNTGLDNASGTGTRADRYQVVVHVDAEVLADANADGRAEVGGVGTSPEVARRLCCDANVVTMTHDRDGKVVEVGRKTRTVSTRMRRKLLERDGCCRFPGCDNKIVDAHHVKHWSTGGETTLGNLVHLCRTHHGMVHELGYTMSGDTNGELTFRTPNGAVLPKHPMPLRPGTPIAKVAAQEMGLWRGDRIDYGYVIGHMLSW